MTTLSLDPQQRVPWRARRDLVVRRVQAHGTREWWIKDPLTRQYFRFPDEDYQVFRRLDGHCTWGDLEAEAQRRGTESRSREDWQIFLSRLFQEGLLWYAGECGPGKAVPKKRHAFSGWLNSLPNPLFLHAGRVDPSRLLDRLSPCVQWCFAPLMLALCVLLVLAAGLLLIVQAEVVRSRLPEFRDFFTPAQAGWLLLVLLCAKVLHELGHALTCKHFGGEVHEMGVLLLCFAPCLYCDTSDSWMLRSKWQRAAIGAAGMAVELVLASVATFLWWFSNPGLFQNLCLNVMFVCSAQTLLFNANPLLRYDGYYILADLVEIPNLRARSREAFQSWLGWLCLGWPRSVESNRGPAGGLALAGYGLASTVYSWLMMFSIAWFLHRVFQPYRLEIVGTGMMVLLFAGLAARPWFWVRNLFVGGQEFSPVAPFRLLGTLFVLAALTAAVAIWPWPQHVLAPCVLELGSAQRVFVTVGGQLEEVHVRPGERVEAGQTLARLRDLERELSSQRLEHQRAQQALEIEQLRSERLENPAAAARVPVAEAILADLDRKLLQRTSETDKMVLVAPQAGIVIPPPRKRVSENSGALPHWSGCPWEEANLGCTLAPGVLGCLIADPTKWEAVLLVEQGDVEFVRPGQTVAVALDSQPGQAFRGTVSEVSEVELAAIPPQLTGRAGGELATQRTAGGEERPWETLYLVRVPLTDATGMFRPDARGRARIRVGTQTGLQAGFRWLAKTFTFRW